MSSFLSLIVNFLILFIGLCGCFDCEPYGEMFGPTHTMCRYPPGSGCEKLDRGVDEETKQEILTLHNKLRLKVAQGKQKGQPSAANMHEFTWSDELAEVAQRWADQCNFDHDKNRNIPEFAKVGQNIAMVMGSFNMNPKRNFGSHAILPWFNEVAQFKSKYISPFLYHKSYGHYTQVSWADTLEIGCGFSFFIDEDQVQTKFYVCNYGPSGNVVGGSMYVKGPPCSGCNACSKTYPGLCL